MNNSMIIEKKKKISISLDKESRLKLKETKHPLSTTLNYLLMQLLVKSKDEILEVKKSIIKTEQKKGKYVVTLSPSAVSYFKEKHFNLSRLLNFLLNEYLDSLEKK